MKCPVCQHEEFEELSPGEVKCTHCKTVLVLDRGWFYIKHALLASIWLITILIMFFFELKYGIVFAIAAALLIVFVDWKTDKYRIKPYERKF
ncbi:MAG: hypothetical protein PVJ63_07010 [Thioalkalispiraceae bacterium]|jgi:hypothetical protein